MSAGPLSPDGGASLQGEPALVAAEAHNNGPMVLVGGPGQEYIAQTLSTAPQVDAAIRKAGGGAVVYDGLVNVNSRGSNPLGFV